MRFIHRTGTLLLLALLVGCGGKDQFGGAAKGKIDGNAKELIIGKWDQVNQDPKDTSVDRCEYTRDGKYRSWFLKRTPAGLKTLDNTEPGEPVNEGPYRFVDERTYTITTTNGTVTGTNSFTIESLSKDKLVIMTDEGRRISHTRVK
jgi:hypothetical protein